MTITINGKKRNFKEFIKSKEEFIDLIKKVYNKVNFENESINSSILQIYHRLLNEEGNVRYLRLNRWFPKQFGFKQSNKFTLEYWVERGFSELEFQQSIKEKSQISSLSISKFKKSQKIQKFNYKEGYSNQFKFNNQLFTSECVPKCNSCNGQLVIYQSNHYNSPIWKIKGCSNSECITKSTKSKDILWKAFLPSEKYNELKSNLKSVKRAFSLDFWINKGMSIEEAKNKQFEIQSSNSKKVKYRPGKSKENLRKKGYSEDDIKKACLTMTNNQYWTDRGYSLEESIEKVRSHQSNAAKYVDFEKRILPSNIEYWTNRGFSEEDARLKVSESQTTFSKEICINKYGEEDGTKRWKDRQEKWLKNYKKNNFSKISQELFQEIYKRVGYKYSDIYFATLKGGSIVDGTSNNEYRLDLVESYILPDFFIPEIKKIIEFDGVYYHRNTPENKTREEFRDSQIIKSGFSVFHVSEKKYMEDKELVINECINFLQS